MLQLLDILAKKEGFEKTEELYKYLRQASWEKGIPLIGTFELTPRCTLDCKMCYVHLNKNQMKQEELTTEQWISLIDEACDTGMMFATLTGGECTLYPGFRQIYEHLQARGVLVTILTNGTLLDEETVDWLAERSPQRVQISVYGSSPEGYEAVTGSGDAFYKVDKAIDLIKKSGIPFTLAITVSKQLVGDFEEILKYCKSKEPLRCDVTTFPFEARKETDRKYNNYAPSLDDQVEVFKIRLKLDGKNITPYSCEEELLNETILKDDIISSNKGISCLAGRNSFSISWDGRMLACNSFNFVEALPFKTGFISAWRLINKQACEYNMPVECIDCSYKRVCAHCPAIHWLSVGEGHCNPNVCEEGKRMALEGIRKL